VLTDLPNESETANELDSTTIIDESEDLIDELQAASVASDDHVRLEKAVAACLRFIGYDVEHKDKRGVALPDLVIASSLPSSCYRTVVDAKARASGHLTGLEVLTLVEYRNQFNADFAAVVAGSFADGKMVRHAEQSGVVLLTVEALSDWMRLHAVTPPLSLADYEPIFTTPGMVDALPEEIRQAADQQRRWKRTDRAAAVRTPGCLP